MFTKGPWKEGIIEESIADSGGDRMIAYVSERYRSPEEVMANRRLIIKAPDLFFLTKDFEFVLTSKLQILEKSIRRTRHTKRKFEEVENMIQQVRGVIGFVENGRKK